MTRSLEFAMGMLYKENLFYGALATAYPFETKASAERGCLITMSLKTRTWENYACGTRTIDGMTWGPDGELFGTENQGNWVPTSKLLHFQKGHFYGVHKDVPGPFDNVPETPPAVWLENGVIRISPTQPVYLKSTTNLTVSFAKLSADKKKVILTISGMQLKDVIYIKLNNVMSATGNVAPWSTETWYTLNAFGPASPTTKVGPSTAVDRQQPTVNVRALAGGKVSFYVASAGNFSLDIRDAQGRVVENRAGMGPGEPGGVWARGLFDDLEKCRRSLPSTHCESLKV